MVDFAKYNNIMCKSALKGDGGHWQEYPRSIYLEQLKREGEVLCVSFGQVGVYDCLAGGAQLQPLHPLHVRLPRAIERVQVGHLRRRVEDRLRLGDLVPVEDLQVSLEEVDHLPRLHCFPCDLFGLKVAWSQAVADEVAQMFCEPVMKTFCR